jgi:hypothetical protein
MAGFVRFLSLSLALVLLPLSSPLQAAEEDTGLFRKLSAPIEVHGFCELRAGCRTQKDPYEKSISVMESRLQADLFFHKDWAQLKYKGDVWLDGITEKGEYDTREAWLFLRPIDLLDVKIGRQILTWGTGDLVFLNDLFPKDWQSFFIGRQAEYLKAPSDAVKFSFFTKLANIDVVYTPKFDPDRYITGEYISYWNSTQESLAGRNAIIDAEEPDRWFRDFELAVRVYRKIRRYELALYGYRGYWKRPGGQTPSGENIFPRLNVYGASARGPVGRGIGNIELAFYQSVDDQSGFNPWIDNSEMRYLVGYAREIGKDFNASLQYYVEQILSYSAYKENLTSGPTKDQFRHVITLQLTKLLLNQNLTVSLSGYFSPSDVDGYLRPYIHYQYTDRLALELGANMFFGEHPYTFFGQFQNNTNIYTAIRYSF